MHDLQVSMDWVRILVFQVMLQPSLSDLFIVESQCALYETKFGEDVVMGCTFMPAPSNPQNILRVAWHWIGATSSREVYQIENSMEVSASQDPDYRGRVTLLTEELKDGMAKLKVSNLRINDSGRYQCFVKTDDGADFKEMTLSVKAPYKTVAKHIHKAAERDEVVLTCQSEGYPKSSVTWRDGNMRRINSNTSAVSTPDQLFKVTSEIRVQACDRNNYTCNFTEDGHSATFHIPDEIPIPQEKNNHLIVLLTMGVVICAIIIAGFVYRRRKGCTSPRSRNHSVNGRDRSAVCLQIDTHNEDERTIFNRGCIEENLGALVKGHHSRVYCSADARRHLNALGAEELPYRLQNNAGQPVDLQSLLPKAGETLLLEGPQGGGKTTIAHFLIYCWTEGPTHSLDLSIIQLLLYVDCSKVTGGLLQEITNQISVLGNKSTENELRTALTTSSEVLLLLDGYMEGKQLFDESLKRFLSERRGCRVLVTACPGHCPMLRDAVGSGGVLELQTVRATKVCGR